MSSTSTAIDTGAGLERLAFVMQDKPNMYEIDEVFPVIQAAGGDEPERATVSVRWPRGRRAYHDDVRMRVVADHVRSSLMLIGDGVRPGNDGRGYVLRRLIRRAVRSMRLLGVDEVVHADAAHRLEGRDEGVLPRARRPNLEDDPPRSPRPKRTPSAGPWPGTARSSTLRRDRKGIRRAPPCSPVATAFALHDTYGFPIDLTLEMAAEQGRQVDEGEFRALWQEQKERARADARAKKTGHVDVRVFHEI